MDRKEVIEGLRSCVDKRGSCLRCPYFPQENCDALLLADALALLEPRIIRPAEYAAWSADAWAEDMETGVVVALDQQAVPSYVRYMRFDGDGPKRLWTARPDPAPAGEEGEP